MLVCCRSNRRIKLNIYLRKYNRSEVETLHVGAVWRDADAAKKNYKLISVRQWSTQCAARAALRISVMKEPCLLEIGNGNPVGIKSAKWTGPGLIICRRVHRFSSDYSMSVNCWS